MFSEIVYFDVSNKGKAIASLMGIPSCIFGTSCLIEIFKSYSLDSYNTLLSLNLERGADLGRSRLVLNHSACELQ